MNQQIQLEKPAVKKKTLLVNLSLIAYLCLLIGFLQCFSPHSIPYGLFTSVVVTRESASDATIYHSNDLSDEMYATHSSFIESDNALDGITINVSDFATIGSISKDPANPEESGDGALKIYSSIKDPSADATETDNVITQYFSVIGGSSQISTETGDDGVIKYYASIGDFVGSASEVPADHYVYFSSSSDDGFVSADDENRISFTVKVDQMNSNQNFIQVTPSMSDMSIVSTSYRMGPNIGVNTLMALLGGLLPCFLLLLYVWKFHDHPRGKYFVPVACGMIALSHVYSMINIIVTFLRGFGSFTYLLNLVVPTAMAACYIIIPLSSRNGGNVSKKWWVITTIVSAVYGLQACLSIRVLIPDSRFFSTSLPYVLPYALTAVGHVLFLAGLLLYVFFNLLPKKDNDSDKEEPSEPIIESKNMAPAPERT